MSTMMATAETTQPAWFASLKADYRAAVSHTFLLHGGVFDYADYSGQDLTVRDYLALSLARTCTVVAYSPDEGITFPNDQDGQDRTRFDAVLGLGGQDLDPAAALLRGEMGTSGQADLPKSPTAALPMLVDFLRKCYRSNDNTGRPCVIVDRLDLICPPGDKAVMPDPKLALLGLLHRVGSDAAIDDTAGLLILLAPTLEDVHSDLRTASSGIRALEVPLPDFEQRLSYIRRLTDTKGLTLEMSEAELAAATAGLYRRHIEDIALRAVDAGGTVTLELVKSRKAEQIAAEYAEVLEVMDPSFGFEAVGGHRHAVEFLKEWVVGPMADPELNDMVPLGIALLGPPGTGKTLLASALARESGLNCVLLRAEKIKGGIVGESERRLAKALAGIEALAPAIVFIDELDQRFRRGEGGAADGGSAVENNIFGRLLEFFGDSGHRGRIVAVAATNRPDLVDAALFRPGRFDVKIPLLPPDKDERIQVLGALCSRYSLVIDQEVLESVAELTDGWTQAELERLIVKARGVARIKKARLDDALILAFSTLRSATRDVGYMTRLALAECDDASLVPDRFRTEVGKPVEPREKPEAAAPRQARADL